MPTEGTEEFEIATAKIMLTMEQIVKNFGKDVVSRFGFLFYHVTALAHEPKINFRVEAKNQSGVTLADDDLDRVYTNIDYKKVRKAVLSD